MPFRSKKQRTFLAIHHPDVYQKFKAEHGTKIVPSATKKAPKGKK